jgi:hypothetical protein
MTNRLEKRISPLHNSRFFGGAESSVSVCWFFQLEHYSCQWMNQPLADRLYERSLADEWLSQ